jgi:phosphoribosylamine---glycine ligase
MGVSRTGKGSDRADGRCDVRALVLGSGGRESALAWALDRSPSVDDVVVAPGNGGVASFATLVDVDPADAVQVLELASELEPDLVVIGPEVPLVAGVGDALRSAGYAVFGPDAEAARLEGSKSHAKQMMEKAGIKTARAKTFDSLPEAIDFLDQIGPPYVVKADGLAAGKGVVVTEDRGKAVIALEERIVGGSFGDAGRRVLIEEFLDGEEASLIAFTDGKSVVACEPAQDYKRVYDADRGPNTGGMGSYSPVPACPPGLADQITAEVIDPMVRATAAAGAPFVGAIYAGLALTSDGPTVMEFNARFGDPETQALIPRLRADFAEVALACATGELAGTKLEWEPQCCVSVVLASGGYPGSHDTGYAIEGLDEVAQMEGVVVFHAGTARAETGIVTSGGRVLAVSALGDTFADARSRAYLAANEIEFEGKHFRTDIAQRAEQMEVAP